MSDQTPEPPALPPRPDLFHRLSARRAMLVLGGVSLVFLIAAISGVVYYLSQRAAEPPPRQPPASIGELATQYPQLGNILQDQKLASVYKQFLVEYQKGGEQAAYDLARKRGILNANDEVRLTLELDTTETSELQASLKAHGVRVTAASGNLVDIAIPLELVKGSLERGQPGDVFAQISGLQHVIRLLLPQMGIQDVGSVETEGTAVIGATDWQAAGYTGKGVKVGVLDVGFDGYKNLLGSDLPANVSAQSFIADTAIDQSGTVHGSAVAEIIHDIAPDAELVLAAYQTLAEKQAAVDWLLSQRVDMISSSTGMIFGPRDDSGPAAQMVDQVVAQGVLWVNSSGNTGYAHYRAQFTDSDGNGYHEFAAGDEYMAFAPDGAATLALNWDDWNNGVQDLDLYVLDENGKEVVSSTDRQTGSGSDAGEFIYYEFPDEGPYYLQIYAVNVTRPVTMDFFLREGVLEYYNPEYSVNTPGDSRGSLTVGATNWETDKLEDYSSRGPTEDGRLKPELVAPSGVSSAAFGKSWIGTSASCPHVSGAAALILQAFPDYTPQQVKDYLTSRAVEISDQGPNSDSGYGRLWLGDPPASSHIAPAPPTQAVVGMPTQTAASNKISPTATPNLEKKPVTEEDDLGWVASLILVGCVLLPGLFGLAGVSLLGFIVYRRRSQSRVAQQPLIVPKPYPPVQPTWSAPSPAVAPAPEADNMCPRCGVLNRPAARFCTHCGQEIQPHPSPSADEAAFCTVCGYALRPQSKFCPNCGQPAR